MSPVTKTRLALAAVAGGAVYAFGGALNVTQDFQGSHNTIDTTAEYLVTIAFVLQIWLTAGAYKLLGDLGGVGRKALVAIVPQVVLSSTAVVSIAQGEDPAIFNVLAPVCLLTWLVGSVLIARGLRRTNAVPKAVAIALPLTMIASFPLSMVGGGIVTGAYWMVLGSRLAAGPRLAPAAAPAAA